MYPTPLDQFHLSRMELLKKYTKNVGWSDHSLVSKNGIKGTLASIYFGASVVERHLTILPEDQTKDGKVSIRPDHIKEIKLFSALSKKDQESYLLEHFPNYKVTQGDVNRSLSAEELKNRDYFRGRFANINEDGSTYFNWENSNE
jgi:N,N'-diacetyllegionaminate synthase